MRPPETKQTGGVTGHVALQQKRADLKGCRLFRNKAWSVAKSQSQSHSLGRELSRLERKYSNWFGQNPCHVFQTQGFMTSYFLLWLPWCWNYSSAQPDFLQAVNFHEGVWVGPRMGKNFSAEAWGRRDKKQGLIIKGWGKTSGVIQSWEPGRTW